MNIIKLSFHSLEFSLGWKKVLHEKRFENPKIYDSHPTCRIFLKQEKRSPLRISDKFVRRV
jgi:hypothetical protein